MAVAGGGGFWKEESLGFWVDGEIWPEGSANVSGAPRPLSGTLRAGTNPTFPPLSSRNLSEQVWRTAEEPTPIREATFSPAKPTGIFERR
jgi:hypothetical protein